MEEEADDGSDEKKAEDREVEREGEERMLWRWTQAGGMREDEAK